MASDTPREAFIELPSREEIAPQTKGHPYDFGFVANMGRLIRAHPRIGARFGALFAEIMFVPGALDRREREMIAAVAAAAQDCHY
jgi:alkylhydroperoxidase/carboxymuconolactone decarboxylase family protein YurZ